MTCKLISARFLHGRITLFRPMLAQFCLSQTERISPSRVLSSLLVKDCAMLCVENAQSLISLVDDCCVVDSHGIGLLPWWFRVLYLHVAGTVLLAAEFQGSLTTLAISDSWGRMMTALRSHEHLSPFVSQCVSTFERLWSKITTHQSAEAFALLTDGMSSPSYFQDFLRDVGFDPNDIMFGMNSIP